MFSLISILSNRVLWEADTIPKNYAAGTKVRSITPRSFNSTGITSTKYDLVMAGTATRILNRSWVLERHRLLGHVLALMVSTCYR